MKPCLECGEPCDQTRCDQHRLPEPPKPSSTARGYDNQWTELSKQARRLQPFCSDCNSLTDLQTDHSREAWARKATGKAIRLKDVDVVCGACNRARGAARGGTPRGPKPDPMGKAKFPLHTPRGYA
jgi:5-methylcytosine-specific restriction protein A